MKRRTFLKMLFFGLFGVFLGGVGRLGAMMRSDVFLRGALPEGFPGLVLRLDVKNVQKPSKWLG